jgi:hypothetical protein
MKKIKEANIGALDNTSAKNFINDLSHKFKKEFRNKSFEDKDYYTLPIDTLRNEKPELHDSLSRYEFKYPNGIELSTGKKSNPFNVYIGIEWYNRRPDSKSWMTFNTPRYKIEDAGIISHANVVETGHGFFMTLHMNEVATPSQIIKYFEIGKGGDYKADRIDSFRTIFDHEALHIFDKLMGNIQDTWGKKPYFSPRSHDDEEIRRYVEQPLEFRAWVVTLIRELETAYNRDPNLSLDQYLDQSTAWYRFERTRKANPKLKRKLGKIASEWFSRKSKTIEPVTKLSSFGDLDKKKLFRRKFQNIQQLAETTKQLWDQLKKLK